MTNTRVNEIDLLRFIAALSVTFFHYTFRGYAADSMSPIPYLNLAPISKYGYLGVELFFLISGFVILMTAANSTLKQFIFSRVTRLYPAFWVCCTITYIVILFFGGKKFSANLHQYLVNLTMLNGFVNVTSIDGVYWSLLVEIKFYILVSLLLMFRKIHYTQYFLVFWLLASVLLEFFPIWILRNYLIVDYSAYFIAGATFYLIWSQGLTTIRIGLILLSFCLGLFESINDLTKLEHHFNTKMDSYVVAATIAAFFVTMSMVSLRKTGSLGHRTWVLLGGLTYPLYLLHQNIGYIIFNIFYTIFNPYYILFFTLITVIVTSYFVHIYFEKKAIFYLKHKVFTSQNKTSNIIAETSKN